MASILIVEDEATIRGTMKASLELEKHAVKDAGCIRDAVELMRNFEFDAVVTDVNLVGESGLDLLRRIREEGFDGAVVVITAFGNVSTAVEAMKLGADDYMTKPIGLDDLSLHLNKALENRRTRSRLRLYERLETVRSSEEPVLGESPAWTRTLTTAKRYGTMPIPRAESGGELPTILLLGETGVGKGVVAKLIHQASAAPGADPAPFVHVNCAALPASLIESELFGHERGAFTDAKAARAGLFEMAEGGTIFLDEIGEMPLDMQAKLLTVVEKGMFRRIGGQRERSVRARVIAATNQDLQKQVKDGRFRRDLLFRLNALTLTVPALRERGGDAQLIAKTMLQRLGRHQGKGELRLDSSAVAAINAHTWPGNVRELVNAVKRASILCEPPIATAEDLGLAGDARAGAEVFVGQSTSGLPLETADGIPLINGRLPSVDDLEKMLITKALRQARGNVSMAAKLIGLNRGALRYRIERLGLESQVQESST